ncbi:MAG: hypothetical protein ACREVE_16635 [Gammaproteobacteria bacterium]
MRTQFVSPLFAASLLLAACTSNPLKDPVAVQVPPGLSDEEVSNAIKDAPVGRGWAIVDEQPGVIDSTLYIREHTATIQALYDQDQVQFKYVDSSNLDYGETNGERQIHRNYNSWVDNVANDLRARLSRRAFR